MKVKNVLTICNQRYLECRSNVILLVNIATAFYLAAKVNDLISHDPQLITRVKETAHQYFNQLPIKDVVNLGLIGSAITALSLSTNAAHKTLKKLTNLNHFDQHFVTNEERLTSFLIIFHTKFPLLSTILLSCAAMHLVNNLQQASLSTPSSLPRLCDVKEQPIKIVSNLDYTSIFFSTKSEALLGQKPTAYYQP